MKLPKASINGWHVILMWVLIVSSIWELHGQCSEPIVTSFSHQTDTSITVHFFSNNNDLKFYQIEFGEDPFVPVREPTLDSIEENFVELSHLQPGKRYALFIRSVCQQQGSNWNGPIFFNTNLRNPSECQTSLVISDNNCPQYSSFNIQVDAYPEMNLGEDVFLSEVHLIIGHDWPPDLEINLKNPAGNTILLSGNHGIGFDDYGNPDDDLCQSRTIFTDESCFTISSWEDSLVGTFVPDERLFNLNDGTPVNGIWKLEICDRASGDVGILAYSELKFTEALCINPTDIHVSAKNARSIQINWTNLGSCDTVYLEYGIKDFAAGTGTLVSIPCLQESISVSGLNPGLEYDYFLWSSCSTSMGCRSSFETTCSEVSLVESFDSVDICQAECGTVCDIPGIWFNVSEDNHDWLVHEGPTPTELTGPLGGVSGFGQFIFLESSGEQCSRDTAILESSCLDIVSISETCDLAFSYQLYGDQMGTLMLQISTDGGLFWSEIWSIAGNQGPGWREALVDLSQFHSQKGRFRFVAFGGMGNLNDIALDHILFFGSDVADPDQTIFYRDIDRDGYGDSSNPVISCSSTPPEGYVLTKGDCDDSDENIHPEQSEILCNSIDENCNGMADDEDTENPLLYSIVGQADESCLGNADGEIILGIEGGSAPYEILWSHGDTGFQIANLASGMYSSTITDFNGCRTITDPLEISYNAVLTIMDIIMIQPECNGPAEGSLEALVSGGSPPYNFLWSNQDTARIAENLASGNYAVTIVDQQGCSILSGSIALEASQGFTVVPIVKQDVRCFGGNSGRIVLGVNGGQSPYTYIWNTGDTLNNLQNLSAGVYSCTITDNSGCSEILQSIEIIESDSLQLEVNGIDNIACFGDRLGKIEISVAGGSPPYNYLWNNGTTSEDLTQLSSGLYSVTVSDRFACSETIRNILVDEAPQLQLNLDSVGHVNCPLSKEGFIKVSATGGTGDYQYFWNIPGENDEFADSLQSNSYKVTLIDQFGCKNSLDDLKVNNRAVPLTVEIDKLEDNHCADDHRGIVRAIVAEGTAPFDFNWSAGIKNISTDNRDSLSDLAGGNYNVTITDSEGCVGISEFIAIELIPDIFFQLVDRMDIICFGDSTGRLEVDVFGGTPPYSLEWNTGVMAQAINNLPAGQYSLSITDDNSCLLTIDSLNLLQPEKIDVFADIQPATGNQADGSIQLEVSGGTSPYVIEWDAGAASQVGETAIDLRTGEYSVTITDARFCSVDTLLFVDHTSSTIELEMLKKIKIIPNPASQYVEVNFPGDYLPGEFKLEIYSALGQKLSISPDYTKASIIHLNTSDVKSGLYWMTIQLKEEVRAIPLIIY